ncbi:MAG: hypothetical protein Q9225_001543 [Loekoesia sp. 1 TL-2023]
MKHSLSVFLTICLLLAASTLPTEVPSSVLEGLFTVSPSPSLVDADEERFSMRVAYVDSVLPATPVFMNAIELAARYAELDYMGRTRQRHGIVLPQFPQVEIAILPAPPAKSIQIRLVIWAIYGAVLDMVFNNRFKENEITILWDGQEVGQLYFTRPLDESLRDNNNTHPLIPPLLENVDDMSEPSDTTPNPLETHIGRFDWHPGFKQDAKTIPTPDIFLLALGTIKSIAKKSMTDKVEGPFHVSSRVVDANLQAYLRNRRVPRPSPPFFMFAHILEATRRFPGWMLQQRRFAEFGCSVEVSTRAVGAILVEKGPFVEPEAAATGNVSTS